jgi:hypothetical protein
MAEVKISALTAATGLTDDDVLVVNDGATTKKITVANARGGLTPVPTSAANTRFDLPTNSSRQWAVTVGPYEVKQNAIQSVPPGYYLLGVSYVRGGTYEEAYVDIETAGSAGDTAYYVIYNMDAAGVPTTIHASFGPFSIGASTGAVGVTGISVSVASGLYWCGAFCPTGNTGSPVFEGGRPAFSLGYGASVTTQMRDVLIAGDTAHSTPQDLSAFTMGSSAGATTFGANANGFAHLTGKENV